MPATWSSKPILLKCQQRRAIAGAVFRPTGSNKRWDGGMSKDLASRRVKSRRFCEVIIQGLLRGMSLFKLSEWRDSLKISQNCLGSFDLERGHSRVPLPPESTTGIIRSSFFLLGQI